LGKQRIQETGIQYKEEEKEIPRKMGKGLSKTTAMCQVHRASRTDLEDCSTRLNQ
jgi:hypothetical protein